MTENDLADVMGNKSYEEPTKMTTKNTTIQDLYTEWCKETKRSGSVLVGGSIREFFKWLDDHGYSVGKGWYMPTDEEQKAKQIKGYTYILP